MAMVVVVQVCPHQVSGSKHPVPQCTAMDLPLATAPTPATTVKHQGCIKVKIVPGQYMP